MTIRRWILAALAALFVGAALVGTVRELLSRPVRHSVGPTPGGLAAEPVDLSYTGDTDVSDWSLRGKTGKGAIPLLHGVRSDRRQMVERARFFHTRSYSALLIDLPARGESSGDRITLGAREAEGLKAALGYLEREMQGEPIGVIGVSLGAASFVLSSSDPRLIWHLPLRTSVSLQQLLPAARTGQIKLPVFVISGARPWHATP